MRIVFMGTPEFAVASLDALVNSRHQVVGVVSVADKRAGRGKKLKTSAVAEYATQHQLPLLQPEKLKSAEFIEALKLLNADLFVVVAFRMLPIDVWSIPPKGTINIHGSLLPQYRGAAPINHAIINGETESGLTTFMIDEKIDTGKIIIQQKIDILPSDNAGDLHDKLMEMSREIIIDSCEIIDQNKVDLIAQKELISENKELKPAPKIFKEDCHLPINISAEKAHLLVRGLSPYPSAFVQLVSPHGELLGLKIFKTSINKQHLKAGEILTDGKEYLTLGFENGSINIEDLQLQNKKRMQIKDFLRGFDLGNLWKWQ